MFLNEIRGTDLFFKGILDLADTGVIAKMRIFQTITLSVIPNASLHLCLF